MRGSAGGSTMSTSRSCSSRTSASRSAGASRSGFTIAMIKTIRWRIVETRKPSRPLRLRTIPLCAVTSTLSSRRRRGKTRCSRSAADRKASNPSPSWGTSSRWGGLFSRFRLGAIGAPRRMPASCPSRVGRQCGAIATFRVTRRYQPLRRSKLLYVRGLPDYSQGGSPQQEEPGKPETLKMRRFPWLQ